jgi:hypothetical protein
VATLPSLLLEGVATLPSLLLEGAATLPSLLLEGAATLPNLLMGGVATIAEGEGEEEGPLPNISLITDAGTVHNLKHKTCLQFFFSGFFIKLVF